MERREFLKAGAVALAGTAALGAEQRKITIVTPGDDTIARSETGQWAAAEFSKALDSRGIPHTADGQPHPDAFNLLLTPDGPAGAESYSFAPRADGLAVRYADARGLSYALLELADQARSAGAIAPNQRAGERPANGIRSVIRAFVSEVEDRDWFYDRDGWREYLTMLASQRFNRFSLTFGIGYDFTREVRDSYFHFPYPYLVKVPGYDVRVPGVDDAERQRNLDTLRFIGEEVARRGLHFQVGIWTHAYSFDDSPVAERRITGLNPSNHAQYCRDALRAVLEACPAISGLTLRSHGESGVPEQSYPFWKTVFEGVTAVKRPIELDLHAKGLDWPMVELTQATGMPVTISPKYWAEHMGLPYHQAGIRKLEMPKARPKGDFFALSSGSRSFLRYGYGDLLKSDRKYKVLHRMWPGTQRLLLWGDPAMAAAYGRASSFCGSDGVELCEPLTFKGRKGSGLPGGRTGYADGSLVPARDWEKYAYTYRVWGRLLYNPETGHAVLRRGLKNAAYASALASSSRILPLITTSHMPSAANAIYWPEIYTNQSIVAGNAKDPYSDTPVPKRFGTVSPLDPQLFSGIDEYAANLLAGQAAAKYTPVDVATWLEDLAGDSEKQLRAAKASDVSERRLAIDASIQNGIGRFFAAKFRAGVLFAIYRETGDPAARDAALKQYRAARGAWQGIVDAQKGVYRDDLSFGYAPYLRGNWSDRMAAIDRDIAAMEAYKAGAAPKPEPRAIEAALAKTRPQPAAVKHTPVTSFRRGAGVTIEASCAKPLTLRYRRVNQAEAWQSVALTGKAAIPAEYTNSEYPLQYYFETSGGELYPGLTRDFRTLPYFVIQELR
ncbi:MAG: hypothetical protein KGN84_04665 [Acidobacteriota bacterium]|nr:hypothetical protein [Acidobacteriota bacterium]